MRIAFDHGTLLLTGAQDHEARALPGVVWDPRVRGWRAPAWRWRALRSAIAGALVDPIREGIGERAPLAPPALRPYQIAALEEWRQRGGRGVVSLPTGSGKTRVGVAAIAQTGLPALCLVPTRVLLHQWFDRLSAVFPDDVGRLGDGHRELCRVTVSTFESAWRRMAELGDRFALLVVDEAHHFGGGVKDEALEMSVAPFRLGLTATPPEDEAQLARLAALVGPVVYRLGVDDLAGRYLAGYERVELSIELRPDERLAYERELNAFRDVYRPFMNAIPGASWMDFTRAASRSREGRIALAGWRRARRIVAYPRAKAEAVRALLARHRDARVLVFTPNNETAYRIARDELVMPITCDIGREERDDVLERFRRGELRALVSSRVLNEGLDVPDAEIAVVVGGTQGAREHVQRVGRVLRPAEGKTAIVYELVTRGTGEVFQAQRRGAGLAA